MNKIEAENKNTIFWKLVELESTIKLFYLEIQTIVMVIHSKQEHKDLKIKSKCCLEHWHIQSFKNIVDANLLRYGEVMQILLNKKGKYYKIFNEYLKKTELNGQYLYVLMRIRNNLAHTHKYKINLNNINNEILNNYIIKLNLVNITKKVEYIKMNAFKNVKCVENSSIPNENHLILEKVIKNNLEGLDTYLRTNSKIWIQNRNEII